MVNRVIFWLKRVVTGTLERAVVAESSKKSSGTGRYVLDKQVGDSLDDLKSCVIRGYTWNTTDFASWRS